MRVATVRRAEAVEAVRSHKHALAKDIERVTRRGGHEWRSQPARHQLLAAPSIAPPARVARRRHARAARLR